MTAITPQTVRTVTALPISVSKRGRYPLGPFDP